MKTTTKMLITVTAVAAVVGISAVSYAMWSAGTPKKQEVTGMTGAINTIGDLTVTPSAASGASLTSMNALYPVDQGTGVRYWQFEVTVTGEGKQTVTVTGELTKGVTATGSAALFYSASAPVGDSGVDATVVAAAKNIGTAQEITLAQSGATTVYVFMTADGTDAMKAAIKLTFEATAAA